MIRVLIADDQVFVRRLIAHIVAESGDMVVAGEACTGLDLLEKLPRTEPDVVVMDLMMPGLPWSDTLGRLRAANPRLPVLVVSSLPAELYARSVRAAGASDYLDKIRVAEELTARIRALVETFRPYRHDAPSGFPIAEPVAAPSTSS